MRDQDPKQEEHLSRLTAVGMLAAGIAHEIANPTAFVKSNTNYLKGLVKELKKRRGEDEVIREFVEEASEVLQDILEGSLRIERLVKELKGFARRSDRTELLDLEDVLEGAITLTWNRLKRIPHLEREYGHPPPIQANRGKVEEVFVNLLINAVDALEKELPKARLVLKTFQRGNFSCVSVKDNGPGIPEEIREKVFEPFFTTKQEKGTGLGLYIVKRIVSEHRGSIEVISQPSKGTTFTVCFPSVTQ